MMGNPDELVTQYTKEGTRIFFRSLSVEQERDYSLGDMLHAIPFTFL